MNSRSPKRPKTKYLIVVAVVLICAVALSYWWSIRKLQTLDVRLQRSIAQLSQETGIFNAASEWSSEHKFRLYPEWKALFAKLDVVVYFPWEIDGENNIEHAQATERNFDSIDAHYYVNVDGLYEIREQVMTSLQGLLSTTRADSDVVLNDPLSRSLTLARGLSKSFLALHDLTLQDLERGKCNSAAQDLATTLALAREVSVYSSGVAISLTNDALRRMVLTLDRYGLECDGEGDLAQFCQSLHGFAESFSARRYAHVRGIQLRSELHVLRDEGWDRGWKVNDEISTYARVLALPPAWPLTALEESALDQALQDAMLAQFNGDSIQLNQDALNRRLSELQHRPLASFQFRRFMSFLNDLTEFQSLVQELYHLTKHME